MFIFFLNSSKSESDNCAQNEHKIMCQVEHFNRSNPWIKIIWHNDDDNDIRAMCGWMPYNVISSLSKKVRWACVLFPIDENKFEFSYNCCCPWITVASIYFHLSWCRHSINSDDNNNNNKTLNESRKFSQELSISMLFCCVSSRSAYEY